MLRRNAKGGVLLGLSAIFFFSLFWMSGLGFYNDSDQYVVMHIHREPGYPLFLFVLRQMFGEASLWAAAFFQTVLATVVTAYVVDYISETFSLSKYGTGIVFLISMVPHAMTPMFSVERIVLHASIMSEALTLPLFLLFLVACHKMMMGGNLVSPMLLSVLLSLIRSQFMAAILIWLVLAVISCVKRGKKLLLSAAILVVVTLLLFTVRLYGVKTYNYIFSGHFINNTYGGVNTLTNVLYAADREDGEAIEDTQAQEIFYLLYDKMEEAGWNYKFAEAGLRERAAFLESCHDDLKFLVIEDTYLNYYRDRGITDYYEQNLRADSISTTIMKEILPENFSRWLPCYLMLGIRGMIRSIGVYHPLVNVVVLLLYLEAFVLMVLDLKKDIHSKEGWLMFISLLSILAVAFSTAITIMCLSRYMVYNFIGFYVGLFLLIIKKTKERGVLTWVIKN